MQDSIVTQIATQNVPSPAAAQSDPPKLIRVAGYPDSIPPFTKPQIRQEDVYGWGTFNADRDYGKRKHLGVDLIAPPDTEITSPVSGRVVIFDPYSRDEDKQGNFSAVQITTDDGYVIRLMYVKPSELEDGDYVEAGDSLGTVQDLSKVYPPKGRKRMTNHVHLDIRYGDSYLNPTPLVDAWQNVP